MKRSHDNIDNFFMAIVNAPVLEEGILSSSVIFIFHYTYFSMLSFKC